MSLFGLICVATGLLAAPIPVEPESIGKDLAGKLIQVEGVFDGISGPADERVLRIKKTKARFILRKLELRNYKENLEIQGRVELIENRVQVEVQAIRPMPGDLERFADEASALKAVDHLGWYSLASWAEARARKYGRPELAAKALEAYRKGVEIERRHAVGKAGELATFRDRVVREKRVADYDLQDLEHEILRAEFAKLETTSDQSLLEFAGAIPQRLSFPAKGRLAPLKPSERASYDRDPNGVFRQAAPGERLRLARYWMASLLLRALELQMGAGKLDIDATEKFARERLPDYPDMVQKCFRAWVEEQSKRAKTLNRPEVTRLADVIERWLKDERRAARIRLTWLQDQEQQLKDNEKNPNQLDVLARYNLAVAFEEWGPDHADCVRLLKECLTIDPGFTAAETRLLKLGYRRIAGGDWVRCAMDSGQPDSLPRYSDGDVATGMSAKQVLARLGEPNVRSRVVIRNASGRFVVRHQWVYRGLKQSTHVQFEEAPRERNSKPSEMSVTQVVIAK